MLHRGWLVPAPRHLRSHLGRLECRRGSPAPGAGFFAHVTCAWAERTWKLLWGGRGFSLSIHTWLLPATCASSQHVAPASHQTSDLETESPKNECSGPFLPAVGATGSPFHHLRQVRAVTTAPESREKGLPAGGMNVTAFGATP